MNGINLWKRIHLLNVDVFELKFRFSKLVILDIFLGKKKIKFMILNLGFEYCIKKD